MFGLMEFMNAANSSTLSLGSTVMISSKYLFQIVNYIGEFSNICFSMCYITNSASTTDIGEPIGVPWS